MVMLKSSLSFFSPLLICALAWLLCLPGWIGESGSGCLLLYFMICLLCICFLMPCSGMANRELTPTTIVCSSMVPLPLTQARE
ncbi:MAG: hypothetical protein JOS17DRAFT_755956 [Linnemannia elongata]|nr:MAG: hypothetical protein JOS17DRAFT_755956 [Linnemannia elongata]